MSALDLGQAYPEFAGYEFINAYPYSEEVFAPDPPTQKTRADGIARSQLPVAAAVQDGTDGNKPIPFGTLTVGAVVNYAAHAGIASETVQTQVARYRTYVGLKVLPYRLEVGAPVKLQAVVISDAGALLRDEPVHVTIEEMPKQASADDDKPDAKPAAPKSPIAECTVPSGGSADCAATLVDGGSYRIVASSKDAAPATIERNAGMRHRLRRLRAAIKPVPVS
jgi:hypothetical protein